MALFAPWIDGYEGYCDEPASSGGLSKQANHCTVEIPPIIRLPFPTMEEPVHASISIQVGSLEGWESYACTLSEAVIGPAGILFYFILCFGFLEQQGVGGWQLYPGHKEVRKTEREKWGEEKKERYEEPREKQGKQVGRKSRQEKAPGTSVRHDRCLKQEAVAGGGRLWHSMQSYSSHWTPLQTSC